MLRFVGFPPKLYSIDYEQEAYFDCKNGVEKEVNKPTDTTEARIFLSNMATTKGVKARVTKKLLFNDYEYCLSFLSPKRVDIKRICLNLHRVFTYSTKKIKLSPFDTKTWICDDGISTFAFGHWKTNFIIYDNIYLWLSSSRWGRGGGMWVKRRVRISTAV